MNRTARLFVPLLGLFAFAFVGIGFVRHELVHPKKFSRHHVEKEDDDDENEPADEALQAFKWRRLGWLTNGKLDPKAYGRALAQRKRLSTNISTAITGDQWVEQGPTDISGRTISMVVSPTDPQTLYVGTAGGGVWKSTNGGQFWVPIGDQLASLAVGALAIDPKNSSIIYAGTGEAYYNFDEIGGYGIYKSTDAGKTWNKLAGTANWNDQAVETIAVDPQNSNNLLVAGWGGFYRSTDGGSSFQSTLSAGSGDTLQFSPTDPTKVVATYISDIEHVVVSSDSGATWQNPTTPPATNGFSRMAAKFSPKNSSVIYVASNAGLDGGGGIYTSTDGGQNYSLVTTSGSFDTGQFWYDFALWIDPTNPNRIVVAGSNVYGSTDGGQTIQQIGSGYIQTDQPHPDVHFIAASSTYNGSTDKTLYICSDGGVAVTPDITTASTDSGWTSLNFCSRTAQYYSIAGDAKAGVLIGGTQDNGTHILSIGNTVGNWWYGGDGGFVAMDPTNAQNMYGEYVYLEMFRSTDGGNDSESIYGGISDAGSNANFIAPFILDPNNSNTLLAGGGSLWKTNDVLDDSPQWTAIRAQGTNLISAIAVAPGNSDNIWVGQNDGGISFTHNGTSSSPTWTTVGSPFPNGKMCTKILFDPADSNTIFFTFGGFDTNNVYKTTDGGQTFAALNGTGSGILPEVPVRSIARNPNNANDLYVGTDIGLFSSSDGGNTWTTTSDVPANAAVYDLEYANNPTSGVPVLIAGTHGRGMWVLENGISIGKVALNVNSITGGGTVTGTATLNKAAPINTTVLFKTSDNTATVPVSATILAGTNSVQFSISTSAVTASDNEVITATVGTTTATSTLLIHSTSVLANVSLSPSSVYGGATSTGTVNLNSPAPSGGWKVNLTSQIPSYVSVPTSVTVPAGAVSVSFNITTKSFRQTYTDVITATDTMSHTTVTLNVLDDSITGVTLSPSSVPGGQSASGIVTLYASAPAGGWKVNLVSQLPSYVSVPASVTVPAGASTVGFTAVTKTFRQTYTDTITASDMTSSKPVTLTVTDASMTSLTLNPSSVLGGSPSNGTVTLYGPAPSGGWTINLKSQIPTYVSVPASVTVAAGATSATFSITTKPFRQTYVNAVTATDAVSSKTANLTVNDDSITTLTFKPSPVLGGLNSVGTVTLYAAAPAGGWTVAIQSQLASYVSVPTSIVIPAGATSGTFPITTKPFRQSYTSVITVADKTSIKAATLTVYDDEITSLSLAPSPVLGGLNSVGTVTLYAAAPAGGWTVAIQSQLPSYVSVPTSIVIPAGATSGTFPITTKPFRQSYTSVITVADKTSIKTATLNVSDDEISSLTLAPSTVVGGASSVGTVTLYAAAPPGGWTVNLKSQIPTYVGVPTSIVIPAGSTSGKFPITTKSFRQDYTNSITATDLTSTKSATLNVNTQ